MTSLSVVLSVFVLHVHHRGSRGLRAPRWLRKLTFNVIARLVCIRAPTGDLWAIERHCGSSRRQREQWKNASTNSYYMNSSNGVGVGDLNGDCQLGGGRVENIYVPRNVANACEMQQLLQQEKQQQTQQSFQLASSQSPLNTTDNPTGSITNLQTQVQQELLCHLRALTKRQEKGDHSEKICREWQEISAICDRLLFILFMLVTTLSTVGLLILQPMTKNIDLQERINAYYRGGNDTV